MTFTCISSLIFGYLLHLSILLSIYSHSKPIKGNIALTKVDKEYPDNKLSEATFEVYKDNNVDGKGFEYNGILIYVMAMYTFYVTTHSIINMFKYRKYNSPIMSTAKTISFAAALVSMLSLWKQLCSPNSAEKLHRLILIRSWLVRPEQV